MEQARKNLVLGTVQKSLGDPMVVHDLTYFVLTFSVILLITGS
jgi:hypothetical protein